MAQSLENTVDEKRLIFTVTTGRSGTGFLCHILQDIDDVACFHEPRPSFSDVMREAISDPQIAKAFLTEQKLPFIRGLEAKTYIETSHLACKGFIEHLADFGLCPDLILLSRDKIEVATSLFLLGTIPARTLRGLRFLLSPNDPGVLPIRDWETLPDWSLCYWYCLEIERRMYVYKNLVQQFGRKVHSTSIVDCKSEFGLNALLDFVGTGNNESTRKRIQQTRLQDIVNDKMAAKNQEQASALTHDHIIDMIGEVERRLTG